MRRAAYSIAAATILVTLAFLGIAYSEGKASAIRWREEAALSVARAVANFAQFGPVEELQKFVEGLPRESPAIVEAFVIRNVRFDAHSRAERLPNRLSQDSLEDKAIYDAANRLKATVQKNIEAREADPELNRNPYPELEVFTVPGGVTTAIVPVRSEMGFRAAAQASVRAEPPEASLPWSVVFAGILALISGLVLSRFARGGVLLGAGVSIVVLLALADVYLLSAWREPLRRREIAELSKIYLAAARAGAVIGLPAEGEGSLAAALSVNRDGTARGDILAVRSSTIGGAALPGERIAQDPYEVIWSSEWLEGEGLVSKKGLLSWAAGISLIALALWVLGVLGRISAFGRGAVRHRQAYQYLSPAMLGMAVLVFIPVVYGIALGFYARRYNIFEFVGLANYLGILSDFNVYDPHNFYVKLGVTVLWTFTNVALHVSIGLFLALLLNDEMLKARGIYRVLLIIPWAIPNYITALIWKGLFHRQFGAINFLLDSLGFEPVAWFQSFWPAFFTNLATNTWLGFPFMMVVSLGALQSIPADLYEAAYVDGASRWQRFRNITLPLLMPALVPAVIVGTVWTFNMFNIIYLVSGGAPDGWTNILITEAYYWAFQRDQYGYAAAYSTLIFIILLVFTLITNRVTGATKGAFE